MNSFDLFKALKKSGYIKNKKEEFWWPKSGTFEVIIGAILTQQTKWGNVEKSLINLKRNNLLNEKSIAKLDVNELALLIKPSGFYNQKSKNLKKLCQNIVENFENFENFSLHVNKDWLMDQKGIGQESCDSILCYACFREVMVVDNYTNRLVKKFGYEFENYNELQEWLVDGIQSNHAKIDKLYNKKMPFQTIYARFHGKIVEFCKDNKIKKDIKIDKLKYFL
ncbi:MAG: 3-methyladenine DNA glycosylase [Sulfurospirillum sp.]|nr:3-methyladenine DNA glycosylase [Sulfurospirillum sp.]